jgi:integrase
MRAIAESTVVLRPKQLRLKRRSNSGAWQIHYKVGENKEWFRVSSKTDDLEAAKTVAEDTFHEARVLAKRGLSIISKKFKAVAMVVSERLKKEVKAKTGKKSYADYYRAIDSYLIPFFGNHNIDNITPTLIAEFHVWRNAKVGYELKASTQNNHNSALNTVFDYAIEKGWMTHSQRPKLKNTGEVTGARGIFSTQELINLQQFIKQWSASGRTNSTRNLRELLGLYVAFVACTGIRPGTETKSLTWKNINFVQMPSMRVIHITVTQGKTGQRELVARNELWPLLDKLRELQDEFKDLTLEQLIEAKVNKLVFRARQGKAPYSLVNAFSDCLQEAGMEKGDTDGLPRSLYSLRHYYATQRVLEGMSFGLLAKQMGTSVLMIERHYSHLKPLMAAEQLAGGINEGNAAEASDIRRYMNAETSRADVLSLVGAATGVYLSLPEQNATATQELNDELNKAVAKNPN